MSSRRLMNRSLSSDGRFYHGGNDIGSQNRRAGSMSYLSSVRSESRSTLCSVMAQLTEEIQPTFETTLKSKAVSEDTNVKFSCVVSGYPVPEVTWYKDDMQLDRYCGLPKYEISRDDKTHTLQIYNCTLDDAAIYQASAQNSRGIVSCSGVLEVGTMSEFKIHQNYFAKLKLRNENRRREQDEPQNAGKENVPAVLEDVRMSSPERAQRKRRSPMETRGAGSPSEDKAMEVDAPSQTPPVQVTAAASVHEISNSEIITNRDKDSQGLMYIHDSVNNVSSKQNNEHYVKKKIKISTDATEKIKENRQTGRREEMMNERDGASTEKMEVQNTVAKITSVTEHGNKMDSEKLSVKANKSASEESKKAQVAGITSATDSRNKMDITDRQKSEKQPVKLNKSVSEKPKGAQGVQIASVTESRIKVDITTNKNQKWSVKANKSLSEESKRAQGAQTASVTESKNKMYITHTKTNEKQSEKLNKSVSEESKRAQGTQITSVTEPRKKNYITDTKTNEKQPVKVNKSASEELKRAHYASVTESSNKMDVDIKRSEKQKVNKSVSEESETAQGTQITSVTDSRNKMDITDAKTTEKQPVKVNKRASEESKRAHHASVTESSNKMDIDTKMNEKQSEKVNKSVSEELKRAQGTQITSVTELSNKMDITDTKTNEKLSEKVNKGVSAESKRAQGAQIASVTESGNKLDITDAKTNEKQPVKVNKSASEESKRVHHTSLTESSNKMDIDTKMSEKQSEKVNKGASEESKRAQGTQITSVTESSNKMDTKMTEKQSEKAKESFSESKRVQKPITAQKQLPPKFSMMTQMNKVVESTKLTESDKGTSNLQPQVLDSNQSCNRGVKDNKLTDFDDRGNNTPVGTCVRIFPHSCGGNDVNVDTGERNASARSLRSLAAGDTPIQPTEPICEDVLSFQKEAPVDLKQQPSLMREVTESVTETLSSCHLASQGKKLRTGDQSVASTKSNTLVTKPQNTQPSEKISSGHVSHMLQDGQVTTAMSSSLGDDTSTTMCEKDSKAENQLIKKSDELKGETKLASMALNSMEDSNHSTNQIIVTEFVQLRKTKSDVVQPQTMNNSSISNVKIKDNEAQECQSASFEAIDNVAKMDIQQQSNVTTSELPKSTQSYSSKKGKDHSGPSTFLPQHLKVLPTEFTIPAIYITDMDSISQNGTETKHAVDAVETTETEENTVTSEVTNSKIVSQISNISECTDTMNKTTTVSESEGLRNDHMKTCDADLAEISHRTETDLDLETNSDYFIKQLKLAALDLDKSTQSSTTAKINAAPHIDVSDNVKCGEEVNSAVTELTACKVTIPSETTDQVFNSTTATKTDQKSTFPRTKTEKSETGIAVCLEEANRDSYQGDKLSLKTQPESPLESASNSPAKTSLETYSPRLTRRTVQADLPKPAGNDNVKPQSMDKDKENQFKVPQVIRKIRPEVFDASGHLKLWCQFFNILSDSTIKWYKDEVEIAEIKRSAGDETQVCLAIIRMSKRDCGVYRCTITNEYGKDSTEYLLSAEFLSSMFLREELQEVGEEIEMTPLIFSKGLADAGCWGTKFYGRVTTEEAQVGLGCEHKTRRLKVIYGLDPVFESGSSCFMKVRSPIAYESREETVLAERNLQITKQDCRIQNMAREYFKIFATETRVIESFGAALEVIPLYFMYLPASSIPYATVEAELKGVYLRYCGLDRSGSLVFNEKLEVAQKCSCLQHWIHQWTNGNVLFSRLEGVDTILTNIGIAVRSKGYQGFPCEANPKVFEQFYIQHQCNYFCGLLNLKPLKVPETLQTSPRPKDSSSPLLQRKIAPSSSSPQTPRKSPKVSRKLNPQT
ncbi:alpha-protein kinase 3 isoform X2 [Labeo rohita]|uniref:alpha-protein kinase 3 isoform X2 n=1 Tax=Labeo rohita TaxID=84645 RepID=UPI0021E1E4BF|nr:alpha-protein kinase 3 isoform X2 [Labeo rohita]